MPLDDLDQALAADYAQRWRASEAGAQVLDRVRAWRTSTTSHRLLAALGSKLVAAELDEGQDYALAQLLGWRRAGLLQQDTLDVAAAAGPSPDVRELRQIAPAGVRVHSSVDGTAFVVLRSTFDRRMIPVPSTVPLEMGDIAASATWGHLRGAAGVVRWLADRPQLVVLAVTPRGTVLAEQTPQQLLAVVSGGPGRT